MTDNGKDVALAILDEISRIDQLAQSQLRLALPRGMETSHFAVLRLLSNEAGETTPANLARRLLVTKGAMTNTLSRLHHAGYITIRPDWDDGRRKQVSISESGARICRIAQESVEPLLARIATDISAPLLYELLPSLAHLRQHFERDP